MENLLLIESAVSKRCAKPALADVVNPLDRVENTKDRLAIQKDRNANQKDRDAIQSPFFTENGKNTTFLPFF